MENSKEIEALAEKSAAKVVYAILNKYNEAGFEFPFWLTDTTELANDCAKDSFIAGYNAANEWVSVDIEPKTANVIVSYPYGVGAAKYIGGKYFLTHDWAQEIPEVTHWMPLPTPPTT